jgi:hypothetical protein
MIQPNKNLSRGLIIIFSIGVLLCNHASSTENSAQINQKQLVSVLAKQTIAKADPLRTYSSATPKNVLTPENLPNNENKEGSLSLRKLANYLHVQPDDLQVGQARLAHLLHRHGQQIIPATARMPELLCQRVPDQHGRMGMLCKPVPTIINGSTLDSKSKALIAAQVAEDVAKQARMLDIHASAPTLHLAPSVYQWQSSTTFKYIPSKKHFYKVKYADNSALVIKTGEDIVHLGPFSVYTRFGLIE